jgi:alpha-glucosidase
MLLLHPPIAPWLVRDDAGLTVTLLSDHDALDDACVRVQPDNEELLVPLRRAGRSGRLARYEAHVPWDDAQPATLYAFRVHHHGRLRWLAADGASAFLPAEASMFRASRETPPAWVRDQVVYQVFPDRFERAGTLPVQPGEALPGRHGRPWVLRAWGAPPDAVPGTQAFYGGHLDGITARLDHVATVGATALYLNPVFAAGSTHRYDTEDHTRVDPWLGGDEALQRLAQALHARGMRLLLDGVVNHTGTGHRWFDAHGVHRVPEAAQRVHDAPGAAPPRRRWYAVDTEGRAVGWKGHASLPVLDYAEAGVRDAVYGAPDAVLRRWLREPVAADGWRLDAMHQIGEGAGARGNARHLRAIRRAVKATRADAYLLGEHFGEATRWLQGDQLDGATNYHGFALPVWGWLAHDGDPDQLATADFAAWLARARRGVDHALQLAQLNLLGSHDTVRLMTRLRGDVARVRLALTLLFAYAGVPCLYYGDEVGMEGGPDPDCRRCMDWSGRDWNRDVLAHVAALASLRRERVEWRQGALVEIGRGEHWFAFARHTEHAASIVVVNRGPAVPVTLSLAALPVAVGAWRRGGDAAGAAARTVPMAGDGHAPALPLVLPERGNAWLLGQA